MNSKLMGLIPEASREVSFESYFKSSQLVLASHRSLADYLKKMQPPGLKISLK